jgi:hypothetical protein
MKSFLHVGFSATQGWTLNIAPESVMLAIWRPSCCLLCDLHGALPACFCCLETTAGCKLIWVWGLPLNRCLIARTQDPTRSCDYSEPMPSMHIPTEFMKQSSTLRSWILKMPLSYRCSGYEGVTKCFIESPRCSWVGAARPHSPSAEYLLPAFFRVSYTQMSNSRFNQQPQYTSGGV